MTDGELHTLRALTARLLPGPPEDADPGALEAGAAEAIELLLGAFSQAEPPIHAAQGGGFVPLDPLAELGWRIRIEGSRGLPAREFGGHVTGLADTVGAGLALLDRRSREACGGGFAEAPAAVQDAVLDSGDQELGAFVRLVTTLTLEAVYGSPQYGGNRDHVGWRPLGWPGFTQPRGFTATEVSEADPDTAGAAASSTGGATLDLRSSLPDGAGWQSDAG